MSRIRLALIALITVCAALACTTAAQAALPFTPAPGSPFPTIESPEGLAVGDFNGDGRDDVLVGNRDGNQRIALMLGTPSGGLTTAPGSPFAVGHNLPVAVVAADMNGDGKLDAVSGAATGGNAKVAVLLGDGAGGFTPAADSPYVMNTTGPNEEQQLAVADINGDGLPDVIGTDDDQLTLLRGKGGGALLPGFTSSAPAQTNLGGLTVGDFTGDGKLDVFTGDEAPLYKGVLFQNINGGLVAMGVKTNMGDNPSAGDLNGDGRLDIISTTTGPSDLRGFLVNNNVFSPIAAPGDPGFFFLTSTHLDDLDADGKLDLVVPGSDGGLTVMQGLGTGGFVNAPGFPLEIGSFNDYATTGDFNGDGQPDVVYSTMDQNTVGVLLNGNIGGVGAPASVAFGPAAVGEAPVDRTVTITSNGSGFLRVASATVTGANAGDVTKIADACSGKRLRIGATCDITLRFAPAGGGERSAALTLTDNGPGAGRAIPLSGQGTGAPAPPAADTTRPVVSALSFAPRAFRVGKKATATSAKKKTATGTKLRFTLSEAAAVRITVQRATTGRRSGGTCRKATKKLRKAKRCTRYVTVGTLKRTGTQGRVTVAFSGRIGKKALKRGNHRVSITATDTAGNRTAKAATRTFKVVR